MLDNPQYLESDKEYLFLKPKTFYPVLVKLTIRTHYGKPRGCYFISTEKAGWLRISDQKLKKMNLKFIWEIS